MTACDTGSRRIRRKHYKLLLILLGLFLQGGCTALPALGERPPSQALSAEQSQNTRLGRAIQPRLAAHPDASGLLLLPGPREAFAARMLLARAAERSIDVQYYIWQNDITGTMLLAELERAARRGVRVRLLIDDNGIHGLDDTLAALSDHPNFEVRLFNPFAYRRLKWANFLTDFSRLNHRMHNKSFTADNQVTVIGGRNIGDIYFAAANDVVFADLDVMGVGPAVPRVSKEFDNYWSSSLAYPIDRLVEVPAAGALPSQRAETMDLKNHPDVSAYQQSLVEDNAVRTLLDETATMTWAPTRLISDPPAKALGNNDDDGMVDFVSRRIAGTDHSLDLVSPYFVPGKKGSEGLIDLANRGIDVRILTNSLAAADTLPVHAGYAKRRRKLLEAGVELYELPRFADQEDPGRNLTGLFGSSAASLHAKTFSIDGETLFIGSFNLDPRSANLNTEMGFLIESPELAQAMHVIFDDAIPRRAYRVYMDDSGDLYWLGWEDGEQRRYDTEPDTSWMRRLSVKLLSWLPIEWLL